MAAPCAQKRGFTLIEILIVVAIMGLILAIALPNFLKIRRDAQTKICLENMAQIESAKQIWGVENRKGLDDEVTEVDLVGPTLYIKERPLCPSTGDTYTYNTIGTPVSCATPGHTF